MRVVAMFRVSTEKQMNFGASLDAQQRQFRELAKARKWVVVAEFRGCESATQAAKERRVLQEVLGCIRNQKPDGIYVHEQSRLTRGDELEVATLFRELREHRMKVIIGDVIRDLNSIDERFAIGVQSLVDRTEAERIRERMSRGKQERAKQGKKNSGFAPYGFRNPPPGNPNRGTLQIVEDQAAIVLRIFEYAASGFGDREICRRLNASCIPSPRGNEWSKTTVSRILQNLAYLGMHVSKAWSAEPGSRTFRLDLSNSDAIIVENAHEPIVSRELWDAAHSRAKSPTTSKPNLLTGLLWVNGVPYRGDTCHGESFYRDRAKERGRPWLDVVSTDDTIWSAFISLAKKPDFVAAMIQGAKGQRKADELTADIEACKAQIEKHSKRLDSLIDMRADKEISKAVFSRKSGEARNRLAAAEEALRQLRVELASSDGTQAERVVKAVQALVGRRNKLSKEQKRSVLRSIVERIDVLADRTGFGQLRNARGHFQSSNGPRWAVRDISLKLVLPIEDRSGHLATTC